MKMMLMKMMLKDWLYLFHNTVSFFRAERALKYGNQTSAGYHSYCTYIIYILMRKLITSTTPRRKTDEVLALIASRINTGNL